MAILISNDDGVSSPGIAALQRSLAELDEVWVVAPDRDQSAVSHAVTLSRPLRIEEISPRVLAIDGTPTDCINLAVNGILRQRPRLIVSGINCGANLGDDVTYSGTVSAAMEGTLLGIPSIAVSLVTRERQGCNYESAARFSRNLAQALLERRLPADTLLNVNVPSVAEEQIRGVRFTRQGKRRFGDAIVENVDPRGRKYYWIGGGELDFIPQQGTDFEAISDGCISVTPLHLDLTNYRSLQELHDFEVRWP